MKRLAKIILLLFAIILMVASCGDEPDGKWDKMKWDDLSGLTKENGFYVVPAAGGSYTFRCKNYKPWIDHCECDYQMAHYSPTLVYCVWFVVACDNNDVTVSFAPMDDLTKPRHLTVVLTAGDIFDQFHFEQRP